MARRRAPKKAADNASAGASPPLMGGLVDMGKKTEVKIKKASVDEIVYMLDDGTKLRLRPVIALAERSLNRYTPQGDPLYQINVGLIIQTDVPRKLKRKVRKP